MPDGNLVPDPVCGRCNNKIDMAVRTSNSRFAPNIPIRAMSEGSLGTI